MRPGCNVTLDCFHGEVLLPCSEGLEKKEEKKFIAVEGDGFIVERVLSERERVERRIDKGTKREKEFRRGVEREKKRRDSTRFVQQGETARRSLGERR